MGNAEGALDYLCAGIKELIEESPYGRYGDYGPVTVDGMSLARLMSDAVDRFIDG